MQILIIQTAFIGDVVLATSLLESIHKGYPKANLDILVKKGHEGLLDGHPFLRKVLVLDKKKSKFSEWSRLLMLLRNGSYDQVINVHRFFSSGFLAAFSGAKIIIGFKKNPLSFLFNKTYKHQIDINSTSHEIERNFKLLAALPKATLEKPRLYPSKKDKAGVPSNTAYICIAPASVWHTKQWPKGKWVKLINTLPTDHKVYLLGGPADRALCDEIAHLCHRSDIDNMAGELSFLASCAWMEQATMNYVNDSAPLHFASSVNAPVTAVFCSTVTAFGFGPLSDDSTVWEVQNHLSCRPCGLHGKKACPEGHFKCADIELK